MSQEQPAPPRVTLTDQLRARTKFIIDPVVDVLARFKLGPDFLTVLGFLTHFSFSWLIAIGEFRSTRWMARWPASSAASKAASARSSIPASIVWRRSSSSAASSIIITPRWTR